MKLPDAWSRATPVFDDEHLVSCAGLVPVMGLAEQAGLSELIAEQVVLRATRVGSAGVNPAGKLTSIIAGMAAGADSIDDLQVVRSGGMKRLFEQVYAPATLGQFLREFTHGHGLQLASVARAHLVNLAQRTELLAGIEAQAFIDIDSLLRPVYGHAKQGASFGHTKIAGKQVLRRGLSPLATTITTPTGGAGGRRDPAAGRQGRLRARRGVDGREAISTARAAGAAGQILVRGDSAYGNSAVVAACVKAGAQFSVVLTKNPAVTPGDRRDPRGRVDAGALPGRGARPGHRGADLRRRGRRDGVHRVRAPPSTRSPPGWSCAGSATRPNSTSCSRSGATTRSSPTAPSRPPHADITHRRHAIIETVFADLIDGPLAHLPSGGSPRTARGRSARRSPTTCSAPPAPSPARAAVARGATLRRQHRQRPRPDRPPPTPPDAAPARALALGPAMEGHLERRVPGHGPPATA